MPGVYFHDVRVRIRRFVKNLFRSRHAIAHEKLEMEREALKILLDAHSDLLTEEEHARFRKMLDEKPACDHEKD